MTNIRRVKQKQNLHNFLGASCSVGGEPKLGRFREVQSRTTNKTIKMMMMEDGVGRWDGNGTGQQKRSLESVF